MKEGWSPGGDASLSLDSRTLFDAVDDALLVCEGRKGRILDANVAACELYGWSREEMRSRRLDELSLDKPPYGRVEARGWAERAERDGPQRFVWRARRRGGDLLWIEVGLRAVPSEGESRFVASVRNVTERKAAVEALRESEERYRLLVETMSDGLAVRDEEGRFTYVNDRFCEILGYEREEVLGTSAADFLDEANRRIIEGEWARRKAGSREPYVLEWQGKDGSRVVTLVSPQILLDEQGRHKARFAVFTDITERREAEEALHESEEKYRTLVETTGTGYLIVDREGSVLDANAEYVRLTGFGSLRTILGRCVLEWTAPYDRERFVGELARCFAQGLVRDLRLDHERRDGTTIPVEISATVIGEEDKRRVLCLCRDISRRRDAEAERAELEQRLRQAQFLEAVGRLAGGVAHDFNNLLGSILGCVYVARLADSTGPAAHRELERIQVICRRGGELTRQLLALARRQPTRPEPVDVAAVLDELRVVLEHSLPRNIEIDVRAEEELPRVRVDRSLFATAILNMAVNARDAMPSGGHLRMTARKEDTGWVSVEVSDTGVGIPEGLHPRVFEPYFTTKPAGEGVGLGLSTAHAAVGNWGGTLSVTSAPGCGTAFTMRLPAVVPTEGTDAEEVERVDHPFTSSPVLVVEAEADLSRMMARSLESLGYRAKAARKAVEALEQLASQSFGLVVLDTVLPELGGEKICRMMAGLVPEVPVLLLTAQGDPPGAAEPLLPRLAKPFTHDEFAEAVARSFSDRR